MFFPQRNKQKAVLKINSKYALKSQLCSFSSLPFFYYPSLKHKHKGVLSVLQGRIQLLSFLRGFAGGWSFPTALTTERWNVVLTSLQLLGMFCIPLPGSGQVASSKNEGQQASKEEKKTAGKEQFIIRLLWRRHFYSEPN